jgi:hypothetical protein
MKKMLIPVLTLAALLMIPLTATAQEEDPVTTVTKGCEQELKTYCSQVTPGESRVAACLYAHSDKLSGRCEYALYDAMAQLQRFVAAVSYVVDECEDDLKKHCADIPIGEGRVAACLMEHEKDLAPRCTHAIDDVGLEVID